MNTRFIKQTLLLCAVGSAVLLTACSTTKTAKKTSPVPANIVVGAGPDRAIAVFALQYLGMPYVYGGSSPQTGFDCSGLVQYSARYSKGLIIPRTTEQQSTAGQAVNASQLAAGDLIFFNTSGQRISHVGIYLGNDLFIHSPNSNGVVRVENINTPYWKPRITSMRRL